MRYLLKVGTHLQGIVTSKNNVVNIRCFSVLFSDKYAINNRYSLIEINKYGFRLSKLTVQNYSQVADITCFGPLRFMSGTSVLQKNQRKSNKIDDDEDSDDDEMDRSMVQEPGAQVTSLQINSLRVDCVLKTVLGISRNKIEFAFYKSKLRLNGKKFMKKSQMVKVGDELDLIKDVSPDNPDFLIISRVEILDVRIKEESIKIRIRKFKSLTVENYEDKFKTTENIEE